MTNFTCCLCHGNQSQIVTFYIHASQLWPEIQHLHVTINMRVNPEEVDLVNYLLILDNDTSPVYPHIGEDMIQIPCKYLVGSTEDLITI